MTLLPIPRVYLDTNVCRDCIKNRSKISKESIHLMGIIKDRRWECVTSAFTIMELYDIEKDDLFINKKLRQGLDINSILRQRNDKDLSESDLEEVNERISGFYEEYDFIKFHQLDGEEGWEIAQITSGQTNLSSTDCIHFAVALGSECDLLITSDQNFIEEATRFLKQWNVRDRLRICKPKDAVKVSEELMKIKLNEKIPTEKSDKNIEPNENLTNIQGMSSVTLHKLYNADIFSISELVTVNPIELMKKAGFADPKIAKKIIKAAKDAQNNLKKL